MVAYQAPRSMGFSRQEYWSGLPFPSPGDLPNPGIEPRSPALQTDALPSDPRSLVFPILLFSSIFLHRSLRKAFLSPCYSLELCIQMGISFLFSLLLASLLFTAICKASSDNHFAFLHFFLEVYLYSFTLWFSWFLV